MGHPFKDVEKITKSLIFSSLKFYNPQSVKVRTLNITLKHHRDIDTPTGRAILLYDTSVWHSVQFDLYV